MHPAAYVVLDVMPLSPNGKVDRKALPAPEGRRELEDVATAPRSDLEREIASVWRDVLRLDEIGIHDNFFELGGHSLLAMQLTARLHRALGVELQLTSIFQAPTIAEMGDLVLSMWLEEQGTEAAEALLDEVQGIGREDPALGRHR
jgi:acyl carrier protein